MARSSDPDWPTQHPWNRLPRDGAHPHTPPEGRDWLTNPPRGPQNGYLDADANEWVPHFPPLVPLHFHWDVQHPNGRHTNVGTDGAVDHGADNF